MKWYPQQNPLVGRGRMLLNSLIQPGLSLQSIKVFTNYFLPKPFPAFDDNTHLEETMQWLSRAHDATKRMGISAAYYLQKGWDVPYPETSGYIIATFCSFAALTGQSIYYERAVEIGNWEIDIQSPSGGVVSSPVKKQTRVFNTGQVVLGWCKLFELTQDEKYLDSARKAGDYIVKCQEQNGAWIKDTHCGARTYHARVDWALTKLYNLTQSEKYLNSAKKNIKWVLEQQKDTGWFDNCGFDDYYPITHVIVYTLRGLLESYCAHEEFRSFAIPDHLKIAADALASVVDNYEGIFNVKGLIPASFDETWNSKDNHSCLTGNAQLACFLYRLFQTNKNERYCNVAMTLCEALKGTQAIKTTIASIRGAIPGAFPLWNGYAMNAYPNWACKFFADALMMKMHYKNGFTIDA